MPNLERRIDAHNKSILRERPQQPEKMCNCRSKPDCPLKGECLTTNVIYQATVETSDTKETYIGLTGDRFYIYRVYKKKLNKPEIALRLCKAPQCTKFFIEIGCLGTDNAV